MFPKARKISVTTATTHNTLKENHRIILGLSGGLTLHYGGNIMMLGN